MFNPLPPQAVPLPPTHGGRLGANRLFHLSYKQISKYLKKRLITQPLFACMREDLIKGGKALLAFFESGVVCDDIVGGGETYAIAPMHIEPEIALHFY